MGFNIEYLERRISVRIRSRGNLFEIHGSQKQLEVAEAVLRQLYVETNEREEIDVEFLQVFLQESELEGMVEKGGTPNSSIVERESQQFEDSLIRTRKKTIKPRGANQSSYVGRIRSHDICFGIGPAGTGKTYLAVACAVEALESGRVSRILLVRPAVEAGERLGFLPGDLAQKIDPYLRPLYDALYEMLGMERVNKFIERNIIEIAPLAYMRGRTLNNAFIILDESQNTTVAQMKMFLTRLGIGSTAVVTGDPSQIDLATKEESGLTHAKSILGKIEDISFVHFSSSDVSRHPLVRKIIDAYGQENRNGPL
mgnify:CR=1 FL=1